MFEEEDDGQLIGIFYSNGEMSSTISSDILFKLFLMVEVQLIVGGLCYGCYVIVIKMDMMVIGVHE